MAQAPLDSVLDDDRRGGDAEVSPDSAVPSRVVSLPTGHADANEHALHFYRSDSELCASVADYVSRGLHAGSPVIVFGTREHEGGIRELLESAGVALSDAIEQGRLRFIDGRALLVEIMIGDRPDRTRFFSSIGRVLEELCASHPGATVQAHGELVDLLWQAGNGAAAIELEGLWDELLQRHPFALSCAYALGTFHDQPRGLLDVRTELAAPRRVRRELVAAAPPVGATVLDYSQALAHEVARRQQIEHELRGALNEAREHEAALAESQRQLCAITDALPVLVSYVDAQGRYRFVNQAYERWFGVLREEIVGRRVADVVGPEAYAELADIVARALAGRRVAVQRLVPYLHGGPRFVDIAYIPHTRTEGSVHGFVALISDISESKRAEAAREAASVERLRLLETERALRAQSEAAAARLALSSRASSAFAEASPQLGKLFRAIVEQVSVDYADGSCITLVSNDRLELAAVAHRDPQAAAEIRASVLAEPLRVGQGLVGEVVLTGTPKLLAEVDPALVRRSAQPAAPGASPTPCSLVIVPLRIAGQVVGALSALREDAARPFGLDDQRLLEEIGDRASVAIAAGRLYEANEQGRVRAELLYELAAAVIRAQTVEEVFDAALDGIERALGASRCSILTFDADGVMRFKAWRGLSALYRAAVEGHTPWQRDEPNPQPISVPDVLADVALSGYADLFRSEAIGAVGFIPLVSEGRLIGKFMVYYPSPRELSVAELDMARAIANHVAAAIGRFSALAELKQTVRFNEIFTGMLGHDLRNPLGAIMAAAQIAVRRSDGGPLDKPLARILKSGERMATMIDQLLDFTRVRVGAGIPIDPRPTDVASVMRQAVDELSDTHSDWHFVFEREGDTAGVWDADRVLQVFSNLVANAVQHGDREHGVNVRFDGLSPDVVSVRIHNMGAVPPELLPRLFEPMAGGDRRRSNSRGLGLGLYISREIIKAHGGELGVDTSPEAGTAFTVRLPRQVRSADRAQSA